MQGAGFIPGWGNKVPHAMGCSQNNFLIKKKIKKLSRKSQKSFKSNHFSSDSVDKNFPANAGDSDLIPGPEGPSGEGNGSPLQYSCLGNPMDRGARWSTVHGVARVGLGWVHTQKTKQGKFQNILNWVEMKTQHVRVCGSSRTSAWRDFVD